MSVIGPQDGITVKGEIKFESPIAVVISGGFCDIFRGRHREFGRVALKRLRIALPLSNEYVEILWREAETWKELTHPHILPFLGTYSDNGQLYLVSPWAENGSLPEFLSKRPKENRAKLLCEAAEALAYLHRKGIVHGDIKGGNILVSASRSVLLCDFGLSKLVSSVTAPAQRGAGTSRWQALEIMEGRTRGFESDVYSFGITIYETKNDVAVYNSVKRGVRPVTEPSTSPRGISYSSLWEVAEKCWDGEPSERPAMEAVFLRLRNICDAGNSPKNDPSWASPRKEPILSSERQAEENLQPSNSSEASLPAKDPNLPGEEQEVQSRSRGAWFRLFLLSLIVATTQSRRIDMPGDKAVLLQSWKVAKESTNSDIFRGTLCMDSLREVALKRPRLSKDLGEAALKQLLNNEAAQWENLSHERILPFLGVGTDSKLNLYLVSPWMVNGSLWDYVRTNPTCDRLKFLRDVAEALVYLHGRGIVHGDVNSENVVVSDDFHALLCDFGRTRHIKEQRPVQEKIEEVEKHYSYAPEIFDGASLSLESDVYAFGMTIYEVLRGEEPYDQYDYPTFLRAVVVRHERPEMRPEVSPDGRSYSRAWSVAEKCWEPLATDRPRIGEVLLLPSWDVTP
ncbi:hypothetical protein FRB99_003563 [Tulasnella sp. 403]|nr:hypothetical protein FRB99_003563 [Tulasnella sp. 403]